MTIPRLITSNDDGSKVPKLITSNEPEPSFSGPTPISQFPQTTVPRAADSELYGFDLTKLAGQAHFTEEERLAAQRVRDQIPGYVRGMAEMYPAIALQNPRFLATLGVKAGVGRLAATVYIAMHSPQMIEDIVFGVPSSQQLKLKRARLVANPQEMQREIARIDNERQNASASGGTEGMAFGRMLNSRVPATQDDVLAELDAKILRQTGEEGLASQRDREGSDTLNNILDHTPQTSRGAAALNLGREVVSLVGPQALWVYGARVANDFRNAVNQSNDPNVSSDESVDTWHRAIQGVAPLLGMGRNRAEQRTRTRAELDQVERAEMVDDAATVTQQLSLMRQAQEHNVPKAIIKVDEPSINLVATLRQAHQDVRPDGVTVIPGVDNPMDVLRPNPAIKSIMAERMAYNSRTKTVFLFGENNPDNTPANRESIQRFGFYPGQRVSYAGNDFAFVGGLEKGMVRIQELNVHDPFTELAQLQRGEPEGVMLNIQQTSPSTGLFTHLLEHVGDITNRMANEPRFFRGGIDMVAPKVRSSLRSLTHKYGFEREVLEQIRSNLKARKSDTPFEQALAKVKADGLRYAEAHKKLPVYNDAQRWARDAAVAFGEWRFNDAADLLKKLNDIIEGDETGEAYRKAAMENFPTAATQHTVRVKDLRLSGKNDNLTLSSVSQDAAFRLYRQLKASQPAELGPREVDALIASMGELLVLPKAQWGALREYILACEASGIERIHPDVVNQIDAMLKDVLSAEELDTAIEEGRIRLQEPRVSGEGALEVPDFIKGTKTSGITSAKGPVYTIVTPSALPLELKTKYESLQHTKEMLEYEAEELKGTQVVDEHGKPATVYHGTSELRDSPLGHPREAFSREKTGPENLFGQGAAYTTMSPVVAGGKTLAQTRALEQELDQLSAEYDAIRNSVLGAPPSIADMINLAERLAKQNKASKRGFTDYVEARNYVSDYIKELQKLLLTDDNLGYATLKSTGIYNASLIGQHLAYEIYNPGVLDPKGNPELVYNAGEPITSKVITTIEAMGYDDINTREKGIQPILSQIPGAPQVIPMKLNIRNAFDIERNYSTREVSDIFDAAIKYVGENKSVSRYGDSDHIMIQLVNAMKAHQITQNRGALGSKIYDALDEFTAEEDPNNILEAAGYDGITHIGGNRAGRGKLTHQVWIPFRENQIFSAWTPAPESFTLMQQGILIEHTLNNIAASNNLSVHKLNEGYDVRGADGELIRHITSPTEAADFINAIQQPSGPELVPELNVPPGLIPPEVMRMLAGNNDPSFVPYQPTEHGLAEAMVMGFRRQIFEGAMRQAKDIAAMTEGKIDLETLARKMQNGAKLTDALIHHERVKAGVDKLQEQERSLTRVQRDDTFRANETVSIKESDEIGGPIVTKYAEMIVELNDPTSPIDIRTLVELSRFVDGIYKRAKKEKMTKDQRDTEIKKLYASYGLSDNNRVAALLVEGMRKKDIREAALHDLVRSVEARLNPQEAMSRDEFMAKKGFNSIQRHIADQAKKVLAYFADYNGIERALQITQYMAHYKNQPRLLNEHLAPDKSSSEEGPPGIHSFEDMVRSGELSVYETSPSRMLDRYIRSSVMKKHFKPIYDGLVNEMNAQIDAIGDKDVKKLAKRWMNHFTEGIVRNLDIEDRVHNKLFKTLANKLAGKVPEKFRQGLLTVSDRAITNLVNTSIYNMIAAYQGGKIGNVPRDTFNALQMANTWFGPRIALEIINRSFGDVKVTADGIDIITAGKAKRGRAQGVIGQEFLKSKPPIPKDHRNPVIAAGEAYNSFANAAIALSGQQITHDLLSIGSFEVGYERALRAIEKLRTMENLTPEKKTEFLDNELDLDMFSPEFQKHFDSLLRTGTESDIIAAAKAYGVEVIHKIMPPYGYGEQPRGWRTVPGRLFGLYGRYQIHILDQLHDMASYGRTNRKKRAALERFLSVEGLRMGVSSALGVDSQNWSALGLWQGSPQYQFASDLISAIRKEDEDALAQVLQRIGASQIPMSSLITILNNSETTEIALMKILTLIKPEGE